MKILSLYIFLHNLSVVRGEVDADPTNPFICSYFDLEELGLSSADKIHMVGYEPLATEGNEDFLHHLTLYTCEKRIIIAKLAQLSGECCAKDMKLCLIAWLVPR